MSIGAPRYGVVGCKDTQAMTAFLTLFGLSPIDEMTLPVEIASALYGLEGPALVHTFETPGAQGRGVRLVSTPLVRPQLKPDAVCGYAIDMYTRNMQASLEAAASAGYHASSVAVYNLGPVTFAETRVFGPEGVSIVLIETAARRPGLLDHEPDLLHSEVQAFVFCVSDASADHSFWTETAGLAVMRSERMTMGEPLGKMLDLPPNSTLGLDLYWQEESASARVELLSFPGRHSAGEVAIRPLQTGLAAVAFTVPSATSLSSFASVQEHEPLALSSGEQVVIGRSPAGVPFEVWINPSYLK